MEGTIPDPPLNALPANGRLMMIAVVDQNVSSRRLTLKRQKFGDDEFQVPVRQSIYGYRIISVRIRGPPDRNP
jgi:hypothetical protein